MYKIASLARFAETMSKQEAGDYWTDTHAQTMKRVSPLAGYVQSHVSGPLPLVTGVSEAETFFDGYSCAWWDSLSDFEDAVATSDWKEVIDDGARIFDMDWLSNMSAHLEEVTLVDGPRSPYKVVWVVRFRDGVTRAEAREYWAHTHGPIVEELDIDRYVQNHVIGPIGAEGEVADAAIGFDGFSECWFRDERQFLDAVESTTWAAAVEDAPAVLRHEPALGRRAQRASHRRTSDPDGPLSATCIASAGTRAGYFTSAPASTGSVTPVM